MKKAAEGSAAKGTQNCTEQSVAQNEKKAREIVQRSWVTFPVTATLGKTRWGAVPQRCVDGIADTAPKKGPPPGPLAVGRGRNLIA